MSVTAAQVKELRERTGVGMMECKKALVETSGDIDAAIELMRKSGMAKAAKKADRIAAEGIVYIKLSNNQALMVEINSETDFVARDENFQSFVETTVNGALENNSQTVEEMMSVKVNDQTVEELRQQLIAKIGENISVRRMVNIHSDEILGSYIHGGRIGVVVTLKGGDESLAKDIAMHIAAMKPEVVSPDQVSADAIAKEKEIFTAQALESGKPPEIVEKMIGGRINKFTNEISLTGQTFVKDPSITVGKLLNNHNATVTKFVCYEVGEGIEKKEDNFREEVMAQVQGN